MGIMTSEDYKPALEKILKDLRESKQRHRSLVEQAEDEEQRIAHLRQSASALSSLCGEHFEEEDEFGLTDAIRMALRTQAGVVFTAIDVKNRLEQLGYPQKSENALASVHTVLKRLALKGEVDDTAIKDNKTAYRWKMRLPVPPQPK